MYDMRCGIRGSNKFPFLEYATFAKKTRILIRDPPLTDRLAIHVFVDK